MLERAEMLEAQTARAEGRKAHMMWAKPANPHKAGTFLSYCWEAGNRQDVRSVDELHRDWLRGKARKPY